MGTHGQGAIADALIGSTAKWVVRQSPIPVLVIRLPDRFHVR
ncbi:MAG: universal stress protein [Thermodesulfobacteriota bacterium]|nr:universal stress protein [Thermodesulfobacteriota bacterium]